MRRETDEIKKIWLQYKRNPDSKIKEKLIIHYLPLVKYVVNRLPVANLPSISVDDLISSGVVGLMKALDRFELKKGVKFETYAIPRIQGAIIDELRSLDWIPRSLRKKTHLLEETYLALQNKLDRPPTNEELAKSLGLEQDELYQLLIEKTYFSTHSLDRKANNSSETLAESLTSLKDKDPFCIIEERERKNILKGIISELTEQEKTVIILYYYEELTLKEIGKILGVSESRISQIHSKAILHMRSQLKSIAKCADILR